jgi:hypothetical protein
VCEGERRGEKRPSTEGGFLEEETVVAFDFSGLRVLFCCVSCNSFFIKFNLIKQKEIEIEMNNKVKNEKKKAIPFQEVEEVV